MDVHPRIHITDLLRLYSMSLSAYDNWAYSLLKNVSLKSWRKVKIKIPLFAFA